MRFDVSQVSLRATGSWFLTAGSWDGVLLLEGLLSNGLLCRFATCCCCSFLALSASPAC